jgi:hypothetical protein
MSLRRLTVISVLRSHFEDVGDIERECHSAVFNSIGVFGSRSFSMADGEESMLAVLVRGRGLAPRNKRLAQEIYGNEELDFL